MKTYYLNGKQITEAEAKRIEAENYNFLKSENIADWKNCKFIIEIER